jgi:hypothetical protein
MSCVYVVPPSKLINNGREKMKKLIILAIPLLVVLAYFQNSYAASHYRSYEVFQIQTDGIILRDFKNDFYFIKEDPGDIKVGDLIRYDSGRNRLKKSPWQLAKITEMTNRKITVTLSSGETREVNMRNRYLREFSQGDQVYYKKSSDQIKKSNFQKLDGQ